jgi:hypothetical protein
MARVAPLASSRGAGKGGQNEAMVATKRYEVPWARGWAFFASPPKDLELAAWTRDLIPLYPGEEENLASIATALLSAPLGAPLASSGPPSTPKRPILSCAAWGQSAKKPSLAVPR